MSLFDGDEGWCLLVASLENFFGNEPKPPRGLVYCGSRKMNIFWAKYGNLKY
jgi:hypothetical protein